MGSLSNCRIFVDSNYNMVMDEGEQELMEVPHATDTALSYYSGTYEHTGRVHVMQASSTFPCFDMSTGLSLNTMLLSLIHI